MDQLPAIPPEQAVCLALKALDRESLISEAVPSEQACGRVLAMPAWGTMHLPPAPVSLRDGVALQADITRSASPEHPVTLAPGRNCLPVFTGAPLPPHTDSVVMSEDIGVVEGEAVVTAPVPRGEYVRPAGEDASPGRLVLPANHEVSPWDVAGLLTAGVFEVTVHPRPKAVFIPTGDEVLSFTDRPRPKAGQVVESNSQAFLAMARRLGADARSVRPVRDDPNLIRAAVREALDGGAHVVVLGAGSSASGRDHSRAVFESLGAMLAAGLAMVPGRTGVLAESGGHLLACAPGPPPGAAAFCEEILAPILAWLGRRELPPRETVQARLVTGVRMRPGMVRLVRVQFGRVGENYIARAMDREDGMAAGLCETQAVFRIPPAIRGFSAGEEVTAELLAPRRDVDRVLLAAGRRTPALDRLAEALMLRGERLRLLCASMDDRRALDAAARGDGWAACVSKGAAGSGDGVVALDDECSLVLAGPSLDDPRREAVETVARNLKHFF